MIEQAAAPAPQSVEHAAVTAVKTATPIDWVKVALALSMPVLFAMEPYLNALGKPPLVPLPPVGTAILIASGTSLISFLDDVLKKRKAAG